MNLSKTTYVQTRRAFIKKGAATAASLTMLPTVGVAKELPFDEYSKYDGLGLAELVERKEVTAEELLDAAIARLSAVDPKINAIAGTMFEQARWQINRGLPNGPFSGVPFLVKDLSFPMKGVESAAGSKLFEGRVPTVDSTTVGRYRKAGLVLFARTHVPELGILPTTESTFTGITRNPFQLDRTAGGSSGGSAAAVAAGITPMASASDGGGSIRIPASCCGLFGMKPTRARVATGPDRFEAWGGLAVLHAITRSVRDSAALLDVTAKSEPGDAYVAPHQSESFLSQVSKKPDKLRIAVVRTMRPTLNVHDDCLKGLESSVEVCRSLGHEVAEATDKFNEHFDFQELRQSHGIMVLVSLRRTILKRLRDIRRELQDDDLEPVTRFYFDYAIRYTAIELEDARSSFFRASRSMAKFMQNYDAIMTPTLAQPPVEHGKITMTGTAQAVLNGILEFMPCTQMANWTGQPAMSVPLHQSKSGLPIGTQFMGRFGDESTLFRLAGQLEKHSPWTDRRPSI